jgi:hypothetical protein
VELGATAKAVSVWVVSRLNEVEASRRKLRRGFKCTARVTL